MKRPSDFSSPIFIELERIFLYRDYCLALLYICFRYLFFSNFEFFFVPKHLMQMMKKLPLESCPFKKKMQKVRSRIFRCRCASSNCISDKKSTIAICFKFFSLSLLLKEKERFSPFYCNCGLAAKYKSEITLSKTSLTCTSSRP